MLETTERFTVSIDDSTGDYSFLLSNLSVSLLDESSIVNRASHVEPCNILARMAFYALRAMFGESGRVSEVTRAYPGLWRVNLSPVNGPILPHAYSVRQDAIDAEVHWLEANFL